MKLLKCLLILVFFVPLLSMAQPIGEWKELPCDTILTYEGNVITTCMEAGNFQFTPNGDLYAIIGWPLHGYQGSTIEWYIAKKEVGSNSWNIALDTTGSLLTGAHAAGNTRHPAFLVDSSGVIYVGTDHGLSIYQNNAWVNYGDSNQQLIEKDVFSINQGPNGNIYVANGDYITIIDQNNTWTKTNIVSGFNFYDQAMNLHVNSKDEILLLREYKDGVQKGIPALMRDTSVATINSSILGGRGEIVLSRNNENFIFLNWVGDSVYTYFPDSDSLVSTPYIGGFSSHQMAKLSNGLPIIVGGFTSKVYAYDEIANTLSDSYMPSTVSYHTEAQMITNDFDEALVGFGKYNNKWELYSGKQATITLSNYIITADTVEQMVATIMENSTNSFQLVSGDGDVDNSFFYVVDDSLFLHADVTDKAFYSIRLKSDVTQEEQAFIISVIDSVETKEEEEEEPNSVEELSDQRNHILIYPNPTTGIIRTPQGNFVVKNVLGQQVCAGFTGGRVDLSHLKKGVYIFQMNGHQTKLIKY